MWLDMCLITSILNTKVIVARIKEKGEVSINSEKLNNLGHTFTNKKNESSTPVK